MEYGAKFVGATVHEVTDTLDGGRPLVQTVLPVNISEDGPELLDVVFRLGCFALFTALHQMESSHARLQSQVVSILKVKGRLALINPALTYPDRLSEESFWREIKV